MDIYSYNRRKNLTVFYCWVVIDLVLTIAYIIEIIKGNRTFEYFVLFSIFTWIPLIISYGISLILGRSDLSVRYVIGLSYIVFYTFVQATSNSILTFVYIMPMLCALVVYNDIKLIDFTCITSLFIDLLYIVSEIHKVDVVPTEMVTYYEIQVACLTLDTIFLHYATKVVTYGNTKLERLNSEVSVDELTNAYNRLYLKDLVIKFDFSKEDVSLAIIDIDSFKSINDTYGHNFGDLVLKKLSSIAMDYTDRYMNTYFIRIGGDEFIILSNQLTKDETYDLATKICNKVTSTKLTYSGKEVGFTISVGVASSKDNKCTTYNSLYETADNLLYKVKNNGKSSVAK